MGEGPPLCRIVNSQNDLVPDTSANQIAGAVKAVRANGGTPLELSLIAVCDGIAMNRAVCAIPGSRGDR